MATLADLEKLFNYLIDNDLDLDEYHWMLIHYAVGGIAYAMMRHFQKDNIDDLESLVNGMDFSTEIGADAQKPYQDLVKLLNQ